MRALMLQPALLTQVLEYSNLLFTLLFAVEMLLKLIADGLLGYIRDGFNVFDGFIVILRSAGSAVSSHQHSALNYSNIFTAYAFLFLNMHGEEYYSRRRPFSRTLAIFSHTLQLLTGHWTFSCYLDSSTKLGLHIVSSVTEVATHQNKNFSQRNPGPYHNPNFDPELT